jgi:transglutaminase-like putative cysteine protease
MHYKIAHTTTYTYSEAVPVCHNEVHLTPRETSVQSCLYNRLVIRPTPTTIDHRRDFFGNPVAFFAVQEGHSRLQVTAVSKVRLQPQQPPESTPAWEKIRDWTAAASSDSWLEAARFLFDSPHVRTSQALAEFAAPSFPAGRPILEAAVDLNRRIHAEFQYDPEATTIHTPLDELLALRRGVCQDFAHIEIGALRSLGLPARYVSGYLLTQPPPGRPRLVGADASHAWVGVCYGQSQWIDLDPTNDLIPSADHITLAWGRDYSDVCPIKGVFVGGGQHRMQVSVDVLPLE